MIDKGLIRRNFSRHAARYDAHARVQDRVGRDLLALCPAGGVEAVLDVGCGTGTWTGLLRDRYATARITALDLSGAMLAEARAKLGTDRIRYVAGDIERDPLPGTFDLIGSNACFQWLEDPGAVLARCHAALRPCGRLVFSAFGPGTFAELAGALGRIMDGPVALSASAFRDGAGYRALLEPLFDRVSVDRVCVPQVYGSAWSLLRAIKYTGTTGRGLFGRRLGRSQIAALEDLIPRPSVTYEVFLCMARKGD